MFSFNKNTFKITLVTQLVSLKFCKARYVNCQAMYHITKRHSEHHQWYMHHRLKTAALGDERFATLCDSSTIISPYGNFSLLIMLTRNVNSTVCSCAFLTNVRSL